MKGRGFESLLKRWEKKNSGSTFRADSFRYLFHPHVTAVARKRSWSFCQKCRWQVTAKHAYTITYMALHEVRWSMVVWCTQDLHRDGCSFMWHQPCQRCKYTTSVDIQKMRYKASHSCRTTCEHSESAQKSGEYRYISDHHQKQLSRYCRNSHYILIIRVLRLTLKTAKNISTGYCSS